MLLKRLKLNANEAMRSGADATRRSGKVTLRNTCQPARAVDAGRLRELARGSPAELRCQTRKKYGKPSQKLTSRHDTLAHVGREPRDLGRERPVDQAEVVVQQARPRRAPTRNAGIAYGMISSERWSRRSAGRSC